MHYEPLEQALPGIDGGVEVLRQRIAERFNAQRHGDLPKLLATVDELPLLPVGPIALDQETVEIGARGACTREVYSDLEATLRKLAPWRKGPFRVFGVSIDAEWRSDMKWQRVLPHLEPLAGRRVLDVGCGNGYYCLRMLGAGAQRVLGVEPSPRSVLQFEALRRLMPPVTASVIPLRLTDLPLSVGRFDTVFSMGVLYHQRSPAAHLADLLAHLAPGGQLVLETLTLPEGPQKLLVPEERYANMRNVWAIPAPTTLLDWVRRAGFSHPRLVATVQTTSAEQRATSWMPHHSLANALAKDSESFTVEGYPAPRRSVVVAKRD